ncbi:hypothetical protein Aph02nite_17210 [Actinoplanes philippinensis]|uniref:Uncharacterized protein n=1 Tax=Actinoplanes philippinensis TaxID=35752 RepID=A0A1I2B931_9ACTN|nr:hypothetical protein [Actinoplanes philippinensis]GIE75771.1 hypothetical protein Aph02nite_17210 [Actinoplanes philippinensis]SFE52712.1 hypothetical protein SAMN05421541_102185 [Actinoplanes philippinensis]
MADPIELEQTDVRLGLLRDVADGKVADDADFTPRLHVDGEEPVDVRQGVWEMERVRWVEQPFTSRAWQVTARGRSVLEEAGRG